MSTTVIDLFGNLGASLGQGAANYADARHQAAERKKQDAREMFELVQKLGGLAVQNQDGEAAARFANQVPDLLKQGYGIDAPNKPLVGAPVMARGQEFIEQQGPSPVPGQKVGRMMAAPYEYDTGKRDFNNPATLEAARKGLMLAAPKPDYDLKAFSPQDDLFRVGPDGKPQLVRAGTPKAATHEKPRYDIDPVTGEVKPVVPGTRFGVKPDKPEKDNSQKEYQRAFMDWQQRGAAYVNDYVGLMARNSQRTINRNGQTITVPPTPEQMEAWRKEGETRWRAQVAPPMPPGGVGKQDPFVNPTNPGGAKAAPAGNNPRPFKTQRSKVPVPAKWDDVALLPEWEAHAQTALKLAPGSSISSRARSDARNREAQGAEDSWHKHRQAFDLVGVKPAQKAKLKAWANQNGIYMLDEGDHLHFQPIQGVDAGSHYADVAGAAPAQLTEMVGAPPVQPVKPGNIDITKRPKVKNRDGSISTVRSIGVTFDDGTYLLPTVIGNKVVSEQEAITHFRRTGQHLGVFKTPADSNAYAEWLHREQEQRYLKPAPAKAPTLPSPKLSAFYERHGITPGEA